MLDMDLKSLIKPRKTQSPKRPKARKPQSSKARVLTNKPDPKAQEPSPARNNTSSCGTGRPNCCLIYAGAGTCSTLPSSRSQTRS